MCPKVSQPYAGKPSPPASTSVPITRRILLPTTHLHTSFICISLRGRKLPMEREPPQSPWGHCHVVLPAADSFHRRHGFRAVAVRHSSAILRSTKALGHPYPGDVVKNCALNLILLFLLAVLISSSLQASSLSPPITASGQSGVTPATRSSAPATVPSQPKSRITAYTLPPDLYRKARNRGRIGFVSRIIGFFYGLLVLCFLLRP